MASKRLLDSKEDDGENAGGDIESGKKMKSEINESAPIKSGVVTAMDLKVAEITNETVTVEWTSPAEAITYSVSLESNNLSAKPQSYDCKADKDRKCTIEFKDLRPLTRYVVTVSTTEKRDFPVFLEILTTPSLEMPEIEEVREGCAYLTLLPLPDGEAKHVLDYLLLVQPLEDAKCFPEAEINDLEFHSKLKDVVRPPFYLAYEFTQEDLKEEDGGQVQVGSGTEKKRGKYGTVQDPKLTSGGFYRVVFLAVMDCEGKQTLFAKESCQMLVK